MITRDRLRAYAAKKAGVTEDLPFGPSTCTMKVCGKIFLFIPLDVDDVRCALKSDPDRLLEIRERYADVVSGPYLDARHWATLICNGEIPDAEIYAAIDHSYDCVVRRLTVKQRATLTAEG